MKVRGFTLLELMVAMAIATIIAAAAVGAGMLLNRTMADTRKRTTLWDEAKRLEESILARMQGAGGDPLRPHQALFVENNCAARDGMPACGGADRVTITRVKPGLPVCKVLTTPGAVLRVDDVAGHCCLFVDATNTPVGTSLFEGVAALLLKDDGTIAALNLHTTALGPCQVNAPKGQGNPGVAALGPGTLVAVEAVTFYPLQQPAGDYELVQWIDAPHGATVANGVVDPSELLLVADHVYDFQVALGFDGNPEDGEAIDAHSTSDEWFGNVAGDALPAVITPDQLRMVGVGIVVGAPSTRVRTAQVLDGPLRSFPSTYLATTRGTVMMRNLNIALP